MILKSNQLISLYVFENDLRLSDNSLFIQACAQAVADRSSLLCVYCLQPWQFANNCSDRASMGEARFAFLRQSLLALQQQLSAKGIQMVIRLGLTEKVINELVQQYACNRIYHSHPTGIYEQQQWQKLTQLHSDIEFITAHTASLFSPSDLPFAELPKNFTPFRKSVEAIAIQAPQMMVAVWPNSDSVAVDQWQQLPLLDFDNSLTGFMGGEQTGLQHVTEYFASILPSHYKEVRNQLMGWQNSTKFSPWLALGCVSPRQILQQLKDYEARVGANDSTYWIYFELLWREFFYWNAIKQGRALFNSTTQLNHSVDKVAFMSWCQGSTGEPLIDACMRQLNQTGYLSNRGRQIAASYLIHELSSDWRLGASYFERMLVDYDVASNWGNWQYIAGVGADPRGGRHFNIKKQQQTHDPDKLFIKQWSDYTVTTADVYWHQLN